jgi:hypothetical protein
MSVLPRDGTQKAPAAACFDLPCAQTSSRTGHKTDLLAKAATFAVFFLVVGTIP